MKDHMWSQSECSQPASRASLVGAYKNDKVQEVHAAAGRDCSRTRMRPRSFFLVGLTLLGILTVLTGCFERDSGTSPSQPGMASPVVQAAPVAPRGFQALAASPTEVLLEWEQATTGVTHLSLERKGGANADYVVVAAKIPATEIDYLDIVQPETEYTYRLFAWAGDVRSDQPAGPVTVKTPPYPPDPPGWIKAAAQGPREVMLSWGEAARAKKFTVLRADEKTPEFLAVATVEGKQIYSDREVSPATRYWYKVRAQNDNPETTDSKVVSVVTPDEKAAATPVPTESQIEESEQVPMPPSGAVRALSPPRIREVVVDVDGVLLRWESPLRYARYAILRTPDLDLPFVTLDVLDNTTNYIDRRVMWGRVYYYKIRMYAADGRIADSQIAEVRVDVPGAGPVVVGPPPVIVPPVAPPAGGVVIDVSIPPPEPPRHLEVRNVGQYRVELRWRPSNFADRYYILRSEHGARRFDVIDRVGDRNYYVDRDVLPDTQYWYKVRAANALGMVADSEVVSVRTQPVASATPTPQPPSAPRSVLARALSATEIELRWSDAANATDFMVLRSDSRGGEYYPLEKLRQQWSYLDKGLKPDTTYWYKIRALNESPVYAETAPVSAKTLPGATPTPSPGPSATVTPSPTPSPRPSPTETPLPTATPTVTPTATPSPTPDMTPSPTPEPSPTPTRTPRPRPTTPSPTAEPTVTPPPEPTVTPSPTPVPTSTPEPVPTATPPPTPEPTLTPEPSPTPTRTPPPRPTTPSPTASPTPEPTLTPPPKPTATSTPEPTLTPPPRPRPSRPAPTVTPLSDKPPVSDVISTRQPQPTKASEEATPEETPRTRVFPTRGPFLTPRSEERRRNPFASATPVPGKGMPIVGGRVTPSSETPQLRSEQHTRDLIERRGGNVRTQSEMDLRTNERSATREEVKTSPPTPTRTPEPTMEVRSVPESSRQRVLDRIRGKDRQEKLTPMPSSPSPGENSDAKSEPTPQP